MHRLATIPVLLLCAGPLLADVTLTETDQLRQGKDAKDGAKAVRNRGALGGPVAPSATAAGGWQALIDASGLEYFIQTDNTFATSSSASGAASEASYTAAVNATTVALGTVSTTLDDAFDGYQAICVSLTGATGPCEVSGGGGDLAPAGASSDYVSYNQNGPATLDAACNGRQVLFQNQVIGSSLVVSRKVFVPSNDEFARWLNLLTNTGAAPLAVTLITSNNLGSDSNTVIVTSSDGDAVAETTDTWLTTFEDFTGTTSTDPRLGHVLQGPGAPSGVTGITFANGDGFPFWSYDLTIAPGQTAIVMNFVTGQPSRADAAAKAAELATLPVNALQCMSETEQSQVVNFVLGPQVSVLEIPTVGELGLIALALALCGVAAFRLRRQTAG
jgi:hypothetical protein